MEATKPAANPRKANFIVFSRAEAPPIMIGKSLLNETNEEKLLGPLMDKSLSWKRHLWKSSLGNESEYSDIATHFL